MHIISDACPKRCKQKNLLVYRIRDYRIKLQKSLKSLKKTSNHRINNEIINIAPYIEDLWHDKNDALKKYNP